MNLLLWLISFCVITLYLLYIVYRHGVQVSISATYYKIKHKPLFSFVLMFTAFPMMILASTSLMVLAGFALFVVATSPAFMRDESVRKVHTYSAFIAIVLTTLSIIIDFDMWYMVLPLVVFALAIALKAIKVANRIWWMEIVAFIQIYITLFIKLIV